MLVLYHAPHSTCSQKVRMVLHEKGIKFDNLGQNGSVGLLVTKTLVIMGDPQRTATPDHPDGAMLRAYDKLTGRQVGAVWMPAQQSGSPMTYLVDGKQFIVVAISDATDADTRRPRYSGEYLAFALPN